MADRNARLPIGESLNGQRTRGYDEARSKLLDPALGVAAAAPDGI